MIVIIGIIIDKHLVIKQFTQLILS